MLEMLIFKAKFKFSTCQGHLMILIQSIKFLLQITHIKVHLSKSKCQKIIQPTFLGLKRAIQIQIKFIITHSWIEAIKNFLWLIQSTSENAQISLPTNAFYQWNSSRNSSNHPSNQQEMTLDWNISSKQGESSQKCWKIFKLECKEWDFKKFD